MSKSLASALLLTTLTATASAQNVVASGELDSDPLPHSVDGRVGMLLGGADVGDADGFSIGVSGAAGYRLGDFTVRGLFDYYKVGDSSDEIMQRRGRATRIGGAVRYSLANNGNDQGLAADFWGEVGAGWEHVAWRAGGILDRPSLELAIGFDLGHRGDPDRRGRRREFGSFMAFRTLLAQAPQMPGAMATCGGPCDAATTPSRTDIDMFFEYGVHWGR
jgi:hypothetical protein